MSSSVDSHTLGSLGTALREGSMTHVDIMCLLRRDQDLLRSVFSSLLRTEDQVSNIPLAQDDLRGRLLQAADTEDSPSIDGFTAGEMSDVLVSYFCWRTINGLNLSERRSPDGESPESRASLTRGFHAALRLENLTELSRVLVRIFSDLLDGLASYDEFITRYRTYFSSEHSKGVLYRLLNDGSSGEHSAGRMLLGDFIHTVNNTDETTWEVQTEDLRSGLEELRDAFGRYAEAPSEEAFWTRQNLKEIFSGFSEFSTLDIERVDDDAVVCAPLKTVRSILNNLRINARHVARGAGILDPHLHLIAIQDGEFVDIYFADDLPPFSESQLENLFDEVLQSSRKFGTGTGLRRIAQQIEEINGSIASYHMGENVRFKLWKFVLKDIIWSKKAPGEPLEQLERIASANDIFDEIPSGTTKFFHLRLPVTTSPFGASEQS